MEKMCSSLNIIFADTHYNINYSKTMSYTDFSSEILTKITDINITTDTLKEKFATQFNNEYYIVWITKIITKDNWSKINKYISPGDTIFIMTKLKGGTVISVVKNTVSDIVKAILEAASLIGEILEILEKAIEMIPVIFDPPKLIDDIMYGITYGINTVMGSVMGSMDPQKPEEEKQTSGPFGVNTTKDNSMVCMSPSISVILMLIICPPLAIFYKYSFIKAIIPAIICGVLCVKLYYFPGLLFASLMVLC
jgi:hypothetical protein